MTHTPGPWRAVEPDEDMTEWWIEAPSGDVAVLSHFHGPASIQEESNAHLIAAVHDLLEALKEMLVQFNDSLTNNQGQAEAVEMGVAAIAKARGEDE
jgi:hypothetical protein